MDTSAGAVQLMTPREEVLTGQRIGPAGAALLYRLVRVVAVSRNFPPPPGFERWDHTAVTETAHDFLDGERGRRRVADIAIRSIDEITFARIMESAIVNHLREISRRTDMGKLVLRVTEVLTDEDDFQRVDIQPARWALTDGRTAPSAVPDTQFAAAIVDTQVTVPAWTSERRSAPLADRETFIRLLRAVLAAADGSLTAADLAQVIATRLDHRRTPISIELDVLESIAERAPSQDPAVQATTSIRAAQIFDQLDDRSRVLIALYEQPLRDLGDVLAVGKSQAGLLRQRLTAWLREELKDDTEAEETVAEIRRICEAWLEDRTAVPGATSTNTAHAGGRRDR
jgi:hypothetical protein